MTNDKCKYKTVSQRALRTHKKFVHDSTFYSCKTCKLKTKTVGGMELHHKRTHGLNIGFDTEAKGDKPNVKEAKGDKPNVKEEESHKNENSEYDSDSDSDYDDVPDLYKYKKWESGTNFKSRTPVFYKASIKFRTIFLKKVPITTMQTTSTYKCLK